MIHNYVAGAEVHTVAAVVNQGAIQMHQEVVVPPDVPYTILLARILAPKSETPSPLFMQSTTTIPRSDYNSQSFAGWEIEKGKQKEHLSTYSK